jgi:hypothetical protein
VVQSQKLKVDNSLLESAEAKAKMAAKSPSLVVQSQKLLVANMAQESVADNKAMAEQSKSQMKP